MIIMGVIGLVVVGIIASKFFDPSRSSNSHYPDTHMTPTATRRSYTHRHRTETETETEKTPEILLLNRIVFCLLSSPWFRANFAFVSLHTESKLRF